MSRRSGTGGIGVLLAIAVVGCGPRAADPPAVANRTHAALQEAARLDALARQQRDDGKLAEATRLAEQSLTLRKGALGERHIEVARSLGLLGDLYREQGQFALAEPPLVHALDIREHALPPMDPALADSLSSLGLLYMDQGTYARAEPLLVRALDIQEHVQGPWHPEVAQCLNNLGSLYWAQGAYRKAEPVLVRALAISEKAFGPVHPQVATNLNDLGMLYEAQGSYDKAEPLLQRALDIRQQVLSPTAMDLAVSLNNRGLLYKDVGRYDQAESLYQRSLAIREQVLGKDHPAVANALANLAEIYQDTGAYDRAEELNQRALAIRERALGSDHPKVAQSLNNLAVLYRVEGAYAKAEPLLQRALDIGERTLGPRHPEVAINLQNLATLYRAQGAYAKAEPLYQRALEIHKAALGEDSPAVAGNLNDLATLYTAQHAYDRAESLLQRALEIDRRALGPKHHLVAVSLENLAAVYQAQGAFARAEPLFQEALDIEEHALGPAHPALATSLNNLAGIYLEERAFARAEPLLRRAIAIGEQTPGPGYPDLAISLENLAGLYRARGAYVQSVPLIARAADIEEDELRSQLARMSPPRQRAFMLRLQHSTEGIVSLHADAMPSSPEALQLALTTILRRKGRVLDSLADNQANLLVHLGPALGDTFHQLARANAELSARLRQFDPRQAAARAAAITALRARIEDLESTLSAASVEFRTRSQRVSIANVQTALPRGAALVEFVRYRRFDTGQAQRWREPRYVAYLLPWHGEPRWVALGEAAPIDAAVDAVLAAMRPGAEADPARRALRRLDARLLAPLRGRLAGISHLILSPDAKLGLVPFEALVDPQGHPALERWLISYVGSGRDLLALAARRAPRSPATIVAAPDYGAPQVGAGRGAASFRPLTGALAEAAEISSYLPQARTLTGAQATKAALAAIVGPAVLHIATHGFFVGGPAAGSGQAPAATAARGMTVQSTSLEFFAPFTATVDDPTDALDRAGLALAGANVSPDGIVSARELAGYDWWGSQLVVLSACDTGVGMAPSGEGVFGMRRALVLSGAASHVVSLWSVSDVATRELMGVFYRELAAGTGRAEALRRAKLVLLRKPELAHPYYWAAFIAAGDWAPIGTLAHP